MSSEEKVYRGRVLPTNNGTTEVVFDENHRFRCGNGRGYVVRKIRLPSKAVEQYLNGDENVKLPYAVVKSGILEDVRRQRRVAEIERMVCNFSLRPADEHDMP